MKQCLFCLLIIAAMQSAAQPVQKLYYENGMKAIEGHWKLYSNAALSTNYTETNYRRSNGPRGIEVIELPETMGQYDYLDIHLLSMRCEGLITTYYPDGTKRNEVIFTDGIPNGAYRKWYSNGTLGIAGNLRDGMPDGPWEVYYNNGNLYYTGTFLPYSQADLARRWSTLYYGNATRFHYDYYHDYGLVEEAFDTLRNTQEGYQTEWLRHSFKPFSPDIIGYKDGNFQFFYKNGGKWAEVAFKHGARTGRWIDWDSTGKVLSELEYNNGVLLTIATPAGKKTPAAYIKWREENKRVFSGTVEAPPPPQAIRVVQSPYYRGSIQEYLKKSLPQPSARLLKRLNRDSVVVQFYITTDGTIANETIISGLDKKFDDALLSALHAMPKWRPAESNGRETGQIKRLTISYGIIVRE